MASRPQNAAPTSAATAKTVADKTVDVEVEEWSFEVTPEQVGFIVVKAREFDVKEEEVDSDEGSNAADDGMTDVLEDDADDPVREELVSFISALNDDAQIDLVALAWTGRGDGDRSDWNDLREEAAARHNDRTAQYLLGLPLLADYLEEGLATFGQSVLDIEADHL